MLVQKDVTHDNFFSIKEGSNEVKLETRLPLREKIDRALQENHEKTLDDSSAGGLGYIPIKDELSAMEAQGRTVP